MKILELIDSTETLKNMLDKAVEKYTWLEFELRLANKENVKLKAENEELKRQLESVSDAVLNLQTKSISTTEEIIQN